MFSFKKYFFQILNFLAHGWSMDRSKGQEYWFSQRKLKKFHDVAKEHWYTVKFHDTWVGKQMKDMMHSIGQVFEDILTEVRERGNLNDRDLVRVHIRHDDIIRHGDIVIPIRPLAEMVPEAITDGIVRFLQSDDSLAFDEKFEVAVGTTESPKGRVHNT